MHTKAIPAIRWWNVLLIISLVLASGCKSEERKEKDEEPQLQKDEGPKLQARGESCAKVQDCQIGLTCFSKTRTCVTPEDIDKKMCGDGVDCRWNGRCAYVNGECIATEKVCKTWKRCAEEGLCKQGTDYDGKSQCVATDDGCRQSSDCKKSGECSWRYDSSYCATTEEDCRNCERCKTNGWCERARNECVTPEVKACFEQCDEGYFGIKCESECRNKLPR